MAPPELPWIAYLFSGFVTLAVIKLVNALFEKAGSKERIKDGLIMLGAAFVVAIIWIAFVPYR